MIGTDNSRRTYLTGSAFRMNSTFENNIRDNNKRLRGGSISGRLRTASDLEEWGWIDKSQKGILKDLLISGNTDLQSALDKFRGGDPTVLQELINQGIFKRHHSIDLLDGIDFDFLNVDKKNDFDNAFGDDMSDDSFDAHYQDATISSSMGMETMGVGMSDLNQLLSNEEDCIALGNNILANLNETTFGNEWYDRNFANSNYNNMNTLNHGTLSSSSNMHMRKNSLLVGDLKDWGNLEYSDGAIGQPSEIFENDVDVDMSMYENLAANLQKTNPSKLGRKSNTKPSKDSLNNNISGTAISSNNQKSSAAATAKLSKSLQAVDSSSSSSLTPNSINNNGSTTLTKKEEKAANKLLSASSSSSSSFSMMSKSTGGSGGTALPHHSLTSHHKDHETTTNNNNNNNNINSNSSYNTSSSSSSSSSINNSNNPFSTQENGFATTNKMSFNHVPNNNNNNVLKGYNNMNTNNTNTHNMITNNSNNNNNNNSNSQILPTSSSSSSIITHNGIISSTFPTSSYSSASVLLLSANGLLPTPGISGPGLDGTENGLNNMLRSPDFIGAYDPEARRNRIERFIEKRNRRVWTKKVKYDVRKNFADSRLRVKGRFVKKEDEELMRELLTI